MLANIMVENIDCQYKKFDIFVINISLYYASRLTFQVYQIRTDTMITFKAQNFELQQNQRNEI